MDKNILLKDVLFNQKKIEFLAEKIFEVEKTFNKKEFLKETLSEFKNLELKQRISHIAKMLKKFLPQDYSKAINIIIKSLPHELDTSKTDNDFGDFIYSPFAEFVSLYGCSKEYLQISLNALEEITKRFSAEFAIRNFINNFPEQTFEFLLKCSKAKNYHLRRFSSEGSRPKLPWAQKIFLDFNKGIKILDNLYYDKTRYVIRSVANHLNDISKIDSVIVIKKLIEWKNSNAQKNLNEINYLIKHSLRTLIKKGNKEALQLLGYSENINFYIDNFKTNNDKIKIGEILNFEFEIKNKLKENNQNILIDYIIYFNNKNNKLLNKKIFKLKSLKTKKDETILINKNHSFKQISTRTYYEGKHKIQIQINGKICIEKEFLLLKS